MLNKMKKLPSSLILLILLLPYYSFGQVENLGIQLRSTLEKGDTTEAKKLLAKGLQNKYFLLINSENQDIDSIEVQVIDKVKNPHKPLEIFVRKLPYLDIRDAVSENLELAFVLIKGLVRIEIKGTHRLIECPKNHFAYLILRKNRTLGLKYCIDLPAPPDTTIKEIRVENVVHDTVCFKIPFRRFFNYRVISSGTVAGISTAWFLIERAKAKTKLDDYHRAAETAEVIKLRAEVEKGRTRRNIAGTLSAVSGVAFAYFLAKDIFCPERKKQINCKDQGTTWYSDKKLHFGFESNLNTNEVLITMSLNF